MILVGCALCFICVIGCYVSARVVCVFAVMSMMCMLVMCCSWLLYECSRVVRVVLCY